MIFAFVADYFYHHSIPCSLTLTWCSAHLLLQHSVLLIFRCCSVLSGAEEAKARGTNGQIDDLDDRRCKEKAIKRDKWQGANNKEDLTNEEEQ